MAGGHAKRKKCAVVGLNRDRPVIQRDPPARPCGNGGCDDGRASGIDLDSKVLACVLKDSSRPFSVGCPGIAVSSAFGAAFDDAVAREVLDLSQEFETKRARTSAS